MALAEMKLRVVVDSDGVKNGKVICECGMKMQVTGQRFYSAEQTNRWVKIYFLCVECKKEYWMNVTEVANG